MKPLYLLLLPLLLQPFSSWSEEGTAAGEDCDCEAEPSALFPSPVEPPAILRPDTTSGIQRLDLFVMSLCPYGMEAQRLLLPLAERFANRIELKIHYIADEVDGASTAPSTADSATADAPAAGRPGCAARQTGTGDGPFHSLHGQEEIDESRRQLIIDADYPDLHRSYLLCRSRQGPSGDWRACARAVGLAPDSLQQRALSPRGERLFRENIRLANAMRIDLSPTLLIDGEEYTGDFYGFDLARKLCHRLPTDLRCRELPACGSDADCQVEPGQLALCEQPDTPRARCIRYTPRPFSLTVLEADSCVACSSDEFLQTTQELFPGAQVESYARTSPHGAELAQKYGIRVFPAYIFSAEFAASPRFARVRSMLLNVGDEYLVQPRIAGTSFWSERLPEPDRLDLFVPAVDLSLAGRFLRAAEDLSAPLHLHFLLPVGADERAPTFAEVVRHACLATRQPRRYPAYAAARENTGGRGDWSSAARVAGVDLHALQTCASGEEGPRLLRAARTLGDTLALQAGSASLLMDNRILFRHVTPDRLAAISQEGKRP